MSTSTSTRARKREEREASVLFALPSEAPITLGEAAMLASVSLRHLMAERSLGRGPKCYTLGRKAIRTTKGDALAWATSRPEKTR